MHFEISEQKSVDACLSVAEQAEFVGGSLLIRGSVAGTEARQWFRISGVEVELVDQVYPRRMTVRRCCYGVACRSHWPSCRGGVRKA